MAFGAESLPAAPATSCVRLRDTEASQPREPSRDHRGQVSVEPKGAGAGVGQGHLSVMVTALGLGA